MEEEREASAGYNETRKKPGRPCPVGRQTKGRNDGKKKEKKRGDQRRSPPEKERKKEEGGALKKLTTTLFGGTKRSSIRLGGKGDGRKDKTGGGNNKMSGGKNGIIRSKGDVLGKGRGREGPRRPCRKEVAAILEAVGLAQEEARRGQRHAKANESREVLPWIAGDFDCVWGREPYKKREKQKGCRGGNSIKETFK